MPRVVHFEHAYEKPEEVADFYKKVFNWELKEWESEQPYWLATTGPESEMGINGGFMKKMEGFNQLVVVTLGVDSVDDYVKKAQEAGAKVARPKMGVPGMGHLAYLVDPGGIVFGIFQPDESATAYTTE